MKQTSFETFTELAQRSTFVPVVKELVADLLDAGIGVSAHRGTLRLRVPARKRRRRGARRPVLVPREGSVRHASRARRQDDRREGGGDDRKSRGVRHRAAEDDGGFQLAVRSRAAAVHRGSRRLPQLRHGRVVRAGHAPERRPAGSRTSRRSRVHDLRHGARVRSRAASDSDYRERAHHARRRPRGVVSVRVHEDRVSRSASCAAISRIRIRSQARTSR